MIVGIGLGDSSVETMGMKPAKLSYFEKTMQEMRDLLAGKEVQLETRQDSSAASVQKQSSHLYRSQRAEDAGAFRAHRRWHYRARRCGG